MEDDIIPPIIEVPGRGRVFLAVVGVSWMFCNVSTGESRPLPAPEGCWTLHHDSNGMAFALDDKDGEVLSSEVFHQRLLQNTATGNKLVWEQETEVLHSINEWKGKHLRDVTSLPLRSNDDKFAVYIFDRKWAGSQIWWSIKSFFDSAKLESKTGRGKWINNRLRDWQSCCSELWPGIHIRLAAPSMKPGIVHAVDDDGARLRILPESTASTYSLLLVLARCSTHAKNRWVRDEATIRNTCRWKLLLTTFIQHAVECGEGDGLWSITVFSGEGTFCLPGMYTTGQHRCVVPVRNNVVQLVDFEGFDRNLFSSFDHIAWAGGVSLPDLCVALVDEGKGGRSLLAQLIASIGARIESGMTNEVAEKEAKTESRLQSLSKMTVGLRDRLLNLDQSRIDALKYFFAGRRCFHTRSSLV